MSAREDAAQAVANEVVLSGDDRVLFSTKITRVAAQKGKANKRLGEGILVLGENYVWFFSKPGKRDHKRESFLMWRKIESASDNEIRFTFGEEKGATHYFLELEDCDRLILEFVGCLRRLYPAMTDNSKFAIKVDPPSRSQRWRDVSPSSLGPCGGFKGTYRAVCSLLQCRPDPYLLRNIAVWESLGVTILDLNDFALSQSRDLDSILRALSFNAYFKTLSCRTKLPEKGGPVIAACLGINRGLETLVLNHTELPPAAFAGIARELRGNKHVALQKIDLADSTIGDAGMLELAAFISSSELGLISLDLRNTGASRSFGKLGSGLSQNRSHHSTLEFLNIGENKLESEALSGLGIALRYLTKLRELHMAKITRKAGVNWDPIFRNLEEADSVECLDISHNNFSSLKTTDLAYRSLMAYARDSFALVDLNVSHTVISREALGDLLKAAGPRLLQLNVAGLVLNDNDVEGFVRSLESCTVLEGLNIDDMISTKPSKHRRRALEIVRDYLSHSSLHTLSFRGDGARGERACIRDDFSIILGAFEHNESISELDVTGQLFGDRGAGTMARILQVNNSLKMVRLDCNQIRKSGFRGLRIAVQRNASLKLMVIPVRDLKDCYESEPDLMSHWVEDVQTQLAANASGTGRRPASPFELMGKAYRKELIRSAAALNSGKSGASSSQGDLQDTLTTVLGKSTVERCLKVGQTASAKLLFEEFTVALAAKEKKSRAESPSSRKDSQRSIGSTSSRESKDVKGSSGEQTFRTDKTDSPAPKMRRSTSLSKSLVPKTAKPQKVKQPNTVASGRSARTHAGAIDEKTELMEAQNTVDLKSPRVAKSVSSPRLTKSASEGVVARPASGLMADSDGDTLAALEELTRAAEGIQFAETIALEYSSSSDSDEMLPSFEEALAEQSEEDDERPYQPPKVGIDSLNSDDNSNSSDSSQEFSNAFVPPPPEGEAPGIDESLPSGAALSELAEVSSDSGSD